MVDVTPRALLNRLERGVVYEPGKAKQAIEHFFKESTLVALREVCNAPDRSRSGDAE